MLLNPQTQNATTPSARSPKEIRSLRLPRNSVSNHATGKAIMTARRRKPSGDILSYALLTQPKPVYPRWPGLQASRVWHGAEEMAEWSRAAGVAERHCPGAWQWSGALLLRRVTGRSGGGGAVRGILPATQFGILIVLIHFL